MVSLRVWHWYSLDHAQAAALFSRMCRELEQSPPPPSVDEAKRGLSHAEEAGPRHRAFATASILAGVAFLEASINELFASAEYDNLEGGGQLPPGERQTLLNMREYLVRLSTPDRFQASLTVLGRPAFDPGAQPYQDVTLVTRLRNALVHYEPRWRPGGPDVAESMDESILTRALSQKKFPLHPFTGSGNPFFPDQCLGHGCTSWAWRTALMFADQFFDRLEIEPPYEHLRASLIP